MSRLASRWIGLPLAVAGVIVALWSACQGNDNAWYLGFPAVWAAGVAWAISVRTAACAVVAWSAAMGAVGGLLYAVYRCWSLAVTYGAGAPAIRALFGQTNDGRDGFIPIDQFRGGYTSFSVVVSVDWLTILLVLVPMCVTVPLLRASSAALRRAGLVAAALPFVWQITASIDAGTEAYVVAAVVPSAWLALVLGRWSSAAPRVPEGAVA